MKKNTIKLGLILILILASAACTTKAAREEALMNSEVKAQAPADTPEKIVGRASEAFSNVEGLKPEQKAKLSDIYVRVYTDSKSIRREIGQSKSLLFMTLAKPEYKESEITMLKKKIVALDQRRLNLMFAALDDVQKVVGKGKSTEHIYKHFHDYEMPNRFVGE
jgi:hypothetical protein